MGLVTGIVTMCLGFPFIASLLEPTPKASSLKFPRWFIHHSWGCLKLFGEAKINLRFLFGYLSSVDGSDFASFGVFEVENYVLFHQTE